MALPRTVACYARVMGPGLASAIALGLMLGFTTPPAMSAETLATTQLSGENNHVTTGTVTIEKDGGKTYVVLGSDFSLDGAPDPKVAFANGSDVTVVSKLLSNTGEQRYEVPVNVKPSAYETFHIWCEEFSVSLGSASLK
ncbi:DM13 domain-containing protein [Rhizobiaceae bacterium]|nr:DM13 domain-containing protein [Rhizobiaceae bacterium]